MVGKEEVVRALEGFEDIIGAIMDTTQRLLTQEVVKVKQFVHNTLDDMGKMQDLKVETAEKMFLASITKDRIQTSLGTKDKPFLLNIPAAKTQRLETSSNTVTSTSLEHSEFNEKKLSLTTITNLFDNRKSKTIRHLASDSLEDGKNERQNLLSYTPEHRQVRWSTFSEPDGDIKTSLANVKQELFVEEETKEGPTDDDSSPPSSFVCESCPESFTKVKYLTEHQKKYHTDKGKKHTCDQCGYSALYQSVLKKHVSMVHEKKMENKCSKCDFATFYQCKLKEHVRAVHDKIKDKFCHMCDARFAKTENLRVHIQSIHDKTKSFQCSFCTYGGNRKGKFIAHMKEVHGESSDALRLNKLKVELNENKLKIN